MWPPYADGCYDRVSQTLVAPGNDLSDGTQLPTVLTHEYGHHIAANRVNPPWDASTWGPKRWASYMHICARVKVGTAVPGDQAAHYTLNPGEAWTESYRQLVYTSYVWTNNWWRPAPWSVVDQSYYPDASALAFAKEDALYPWAAENGAVQTFAGRLTKKRRAVTVSFGTPNDGDLQVSLIQPFDATLTLIDGGSGAIIRTAAESFTYTVCDQRSMRLRIRGPAGRRYRVQVQAP